jgi:hypothetical protein
VDQPGDLALVAADFRVQRAGAAGEGAKQWMSMLTELRNRGLADARLSFAATA